MCSPKKAAADMKLLILSVLLATSWAAPAVQSLTFQDDGTYRFYYETGREGGSHSRSEMRDPDGVVTGRFSYEDPDGQMREVNYRADGEGYVAKGDVSVKGAPKGQFPVPPDALPQAEAVSPQEEVHLPQEEAVHSPQEQTASVQTEEPTTEIPELPAEPKSSQPEDAQVEPQNHKEDKAEMQDLTLDDASSNEPPEAFPPGFFLEKFHGLRRLQEPAKEDAPSTELPKEPEEQPGDVLKDSEESSAPEEKAIGAANLFPPVRPFPGYSPYEWAATMFHQPVYVFAYQQPDSYGYHYFF